MRQVLPGGPACALVSNRHHRQPFVPFPVIREMALALQVPEECLLLSNFQKLGEFSSGPDMENMLNIYINLERQDNSSVCFEFVVLV